jgi:DNA repair protein RecO (recombination protein O)
LHVTASAIICAVRAHGEAGAIVRALTTEHGLLAGYVRGGRSRVHRPVLLPGNIVKGVWRARTTEQLPSLTVELEQSRAPLFGEPLAAAGIEWATALSASVLPEHLPYPTLYSGLSALLDAIEAAPSARGWAVALARYEALLLSALGFGRGVPSTGLDWEDSLSALRASGAALDRHVFEDRSRLVLDTRDRLMQRLMRAAS